MTRLDSTRHRVLYNGDVNFLFHSQLYNPRGGPYTAAVLHDWIDRIADARVDTYLCNVNAQVPWYPSKVVPHVLTGYTRGDKEFVRGHYPPPNDTDFTAAMLEERCAFSTRMLDRYLDLQEAGVNWIAEIAKACRRRNVSPWVTVRMNDMHGSNDWSKSFMNCPAQRDPTMRLSGTPINPRDPVNPRQQAASYDHQEHRDYMFAMIRELIVDYDFEGLELDWLRCAFCCEPPASQKTIDTMTEWLAAIRELTKEKSRTTGKPYPLGLRTPVRLGLMKTIGLDVREYARRGLIDFLGVSNYLQSTWDVPYDQLRAELGDDVALLGVIEAAPNWLTVFSPKMNKQMYRVVPACPELVRGNAAGKLALGVDAIEFYNYFCADEPHRHSYADKSRCGADYSILREVRDRESLRGTPKQYVLASMDGPYMFPLYEYAEQVPVTIAPGERRAFRVSMCAEPTAANRELVIQVVVRRPTTAPALGVSFNGSRPRFESQETDKLLFPSGDFTHHIAENAAWSFRFPTSLILEGWNEVLVFNETRPAGQTKMGATNQLSIVSVELAVQ